ncbi:MAG: DUF4012 domain-containing protein [Ruminococcaceae bacterium]|nr:DUF4012 domain-containing protein [Oscillospiraceae bacterium]
MMKNANKTKAKEKKRSPVKLAIVLVLVALLLGGLGFAGYQAYEYYNSGMGLVKDAEDLKAELKALVTHIEKGNYEAANLSVQKIDNLSAEMRATINEERWKLVQDKAPKYGEDLKTALKFLDVVDEASNTLIKPVVKHLREKGLPSKSTFTKISPELGNTLNEYAALIDELCPAVEKVLDDFNALPTFQMEKLESKVSKYRTLAKENEPEIKTYLKFAMKASNGFIRPVAKFLTENGNSLKLELSMDKVGPELSAQILIFADAIDELCPLAEDFLKEVNTLPPFKIEKIENKLSKYRKLAKDNEADILSLMKFAREISTGVIRPAAAVMTRSPLSKLKTEGGDIDTKIIRDYLSLVEAVKPYLNSANDMFKTNKLLKDHPKQTVKITSKLDSALALMDDYNTYVPLIDVLLGDGSDKTYLLVAQNSAEMRSTGGLPASMGVVTIKGGILHIGEFKPVLDVIPFKNKGVNKITSKENELFSKNWYGDKLTACTVNPHFPRVAELIANGYKKKSKKNVDGVISMTPVIVSKLIPVMGNITLSNGVKLNEKYAVKYLQRDIYFQYYTKKTIKDGKLRRKADDKANGLFAEAAKKTLGGVMGNLNAKTILKLLEVIKKAGDDKILMMWMADKQAEEQVKALGLSGSLNYDKNNPELGIFFNVKLANKLGIYVDIKTTFGKETVNKDGSVTYPVTVKIKNNIDRTSVQKGSGNPYLTSKYGPDMRSIVYFFAPAGGKISSFKNNSRLNFVSGSYQNLKLYYNKDLFWIKAGKTVTFTFKVTTAPGVNVKPKVVTTPLLSAYRTAKAPK